MKLGIIAIILWTSILIGVSLAPNLNKPEIPSFLVMHWTTVAHICLFAITGFIGVLSANFLSQFKSRMLFGIVFGLFLAVSTELAQSLVPSHDTSLDDILADVAGLCVALVLCVSFRRLSATR